MTTKNGKKKDLQEKRINKRREKRIQYEESLVERQEFLNRMVEEGQNIFYVKPGSPQRNELCTCGSGLKYKKCHLLQKPPVTHSPFHKRDYDKDVKKAHQRAQKKLTIQIKDMMPEEQKTISEEVK